MAFAIVYMFLGQPAPTSTGQQRQRAGLRRSFGQARGTPSAEVYCSRAKSAATHRGVLAQDTASSSDASLSRGGVLPRFFRATGTVADPMPQRQQPSEEPSRWPPASKATTSTFFRRWLGDSQSQGRGALQRREADRSHLPACRITAGAAPHLQTRPGSLSAVVGGIKTSTTITSGEMVGTSQFQTISVSRSSLSANAE